MNIYNRSGKEGEGMGGGGGGGGGGGFSGMFLVKYSYTHMFSVSSTCSRHHNRGENAVVACSALKRRYRHLLLHGEGA